MNKILPQANNLDLVIQVFIYLYQNEGCSLKEIEDFIGYTDRQARYYVDTCKYLGLVNDDGSHTAIADDIMHNYSASITERVYECIIADELMGKVFARAFVLPESDLDSYSQQLVSLYHPEIVGLSTFERRSHIIVLWCQRIIKSIKNKH